MFSFIVSDTPQMTLSICFTSSCTAPAANARWSEQAGLAVHTQSTELIRFLSYGGIFLLLMTNVMCPIILLLGSMSELSLFSAFVVVFPHFFSVIHRANPPPSQLALFSVLRRETHKL